MIFTEQSLEKMAQNVVNRFLTEKVALTEGVTEEAQTNDLNPEQIKRLVEAVNTGTFLHKFNNPESKDDRMVEFETADPNAVMNRLLDGAQQEMTDDAAPTDDDDGALDMFRDLPATRENVPASAPSAPTQPPADNRDGMRPSDLLKLRKTAELLREKTYQHQVTYTEGFKKLATLFTKSNGPAFEAFELDAFYKHGEQAIPFLSTLRTCLRLPSVTYDYASFSKVARVLDGKTAEMTQFSSLLRTYGEIIRCSKAEQWLNEKIGE